MGADLVPNDDKPTAPSTRPTQFDNLFQPGRLGGGDAPGKLNGGGGDAPGKLNGGGSDSAKDRIDRKAAVSGVESAALSGDDAKLQQSLKDAFEKMGGDANKFQKFGNELAEQLKKDGIDVRAGKGAIGIHQAGSPDGVEYKLDANLDPATGKVSADVKAQSYDWVTKQDTNKNPADVAKDLGKFPSGQELGKRFDDAYNNNNFSQLNKDLASSFGQAYKSGGMEAVRDLEKAANDAAKTPGGGPIALEENGKLKVYNGEALTKDAAAKAYLMTPEQLKEAGIVNHPEYGFVHIKEQGPAPIDKGTKLQDGNELGKSFDDAFNSNNFSQLNKDMAASFAQAYKVGGIDAVRSLEKSANDSASTPGAGPVALEEGGKLKVYNGESLSKDAKAMAAVMTPEQLKQAGIIKHPSFGYLHIKEQGPAPIELKALVNSH